MTAAEVLPPEPPSEPTRTAWEVEHLDDPPDVAGAYAEVPLPGIDAPRLDATEEHRARLDAEAERDYWRAQYERVDAELRERDPRYLGGRREE